MKLNLNDIVSSPQDLKAIILEIRKCVGWFAQNRVKMHLTTSNSVEPPVMSEAAIILIKEWGNQKPLNQKSLDELITALETLEATLPRITITLAAVPPGNLKKVLIAWCREHIDPNILVDIRFNSTLLGGMVVRFGSHIHDWSFRRQILAARGSFPEVLRRV